jgi:uncharacterized phage protein gp47/JayE
MPNIIDSTGLARVRYQDLREEKADQFRTEFGQDIKTDVQSGFGQMISIATQAEDELMSAIQLMLTAFDPNAAQGVLLSRLAIIMNKRRNPAVLSTATLDITVDAGGATIPVGFIVEAGLGVQFQTLTSLIIAPNSTASIEVTALDSGNVTASSGTLTNIKTPVLGVISTFNPADASVGRLEESDAELRARCLNTSSAINSTIIGVDTAVREVDGVSFARIYENKSDLAIQAPDVPTNQPPHSVFPIVEGGADEDIAKALVLSVAAGIDYTEQSDNISGVGTIMSGTYIDPISGQSHTAHWARPQLITVYIEVTVIKGSAYPADGTNRIKNAIIEWVDAESQIGENLTASSLYCPVHSVPSLRIQSLFVDLIPPPVSAQAVMQVADKPHVTTGNINVIEL